MLEKLRLISKINFNYTNNILFYLQEEQWLWRPTHYAKYVKNNNIDLHLVINLDMSRGTTC